jgi:hypothetical protein
MNLSAMDRILGQAQAASRDDEIIVSHFYVGGRRSARAEWALSSGEPARPPYSRSVFE